MSISIRILVNSNNRKEIFMKANISSVDRIIRLILGTVIIALGLYFQSWWGVIGAIPIITALVNYCPAYTLIGVSTKAKIKTEKLKG